MCQSDIDLSIIQTQVMKLQLEANATPAKNPKSLVYALVT